MSEFTFRPAVRENFFRHVDKTDTCWLWTGCLFSNGYGRVRIGRNRTVVAHRLSWELTHGPIPNGLCACHRCDVRACVNPSHIFLGTDADNVRDCINKNRRAYFRGSTHPMAKLMETDVIDIRAARKDGTALSALAKKYNVTPQAISLAANGKSWGHL